jgi:hypothetical protein
MRKVWIAIALSGMLAAAPLAASETRSREPGAAAAKATLDDVDWLVGEWVGDGISGPAREVYSPPMGGAIAGHFIQQRDSGIWFYELVTIVQQGDTLVYRLKHFNADLTGWEDTGEVVEFPLVTVENDAVHFDGLSFTRIGSDRMRAVVRVAMDDGRSTEFGFNYRRAK